jgi:hypothetical protein
LKVVSDDRGSYFLLFLAHLIHIIPVPDFNHNKTGNKRLAYDLDHERIKSDPFEIKAKASLYVET